jgi:hypothetical protein
VHLLESLAFLLFLLLGLALGQGLRVEDVGDLRDRTVRGTS